jgi:hypothetical protein
MISRVVNNETSQKFIDRFNTYSLLLTDLVFYYPVE